MKPCGFHLSTDGAPCGIARAIRGPGQLGWAFFLIRKHQDPDYLNVCLAFRKPSAAPVAGGPEYLSKRMVACRNRRVARFVPGWLADQHGLWPRHRLAPAGPAGGLGSAGIRRAFRPIGPTLAGAGQLRAGGRGRPGHAPRLRPGTVGGRCGLGHLDPGHVPAALPAPARWRGGGECSAGRLRADRHG